MEGCLILFWRRGLGLVFRLFFEERRKVGHDFGGRWRARAGRAHGFPVLHVPLDAVENGAQDDGVLRGEDLREDIGVVAIELEHEFGDRARRWKIERACVLNFCARENVALSSSCGKEGAGGCRKEGAGGAPCCRKKGAGGKEGGCE